MTPSEIGRRLCMTRLALSCTQAVMARRCDMSVQAWNNNERGRDRISLEAAVQICDATGVSLDWIYRGMLSGVSNKALRQTIDIIRQAASPGGYVFPRYRRAA